MNIGFIKAGLKLLNRRYFTKNEKFKGNPKEICEQIIEKLWNGNYYQTGLGHFNYFWIRDFGIVIESLISTGNIKRVQKTVNWAILQYMKAGRITLCINTKGNVFDAPKESIDALPWLLFSIYKSGYRLNTNQKEFIENEINNYKNKYIDPKTGYIIEKVPYSELRDAVNYKISAYSVAMVSILATYTKKLKLTCFIHDPKIYKKLLNDFYWNGEYFNADTDNSAFSAESNLLPFVLKIIDNKEKINKIFKYISKNKINKPFPMKYTNSADRFSYHWWGKVVMPNYAGSTVWTWMGAFYLQLLFEYSSDEFEEQFIQFTKIIKKYKNFPELLHPNGNWYKTPLYRGEEGMIWAVLYLDVANKLSN